MSIVSNDLIEQSLASVSGPIREKNHEVLQPVLTDLIAYSGTIKQLHWNVVGMHFRSVHLQLDDIYEDAQEAVDEVAERISATGHSPTGKIRFVAQNMELKEVPDGFLRDDQVVLLASHATAELVGLIRSRMNLIENVDTVTADILHQIVAKFEKHHWMLQAQRA